MVDTDGFDFTMLNDMVFDPEGLQDTTDNQEVKK
jgi:hypothetical protein